MISQALAVTQLNLRSLPRRIGASVVAVVGIAGVVVVLVSVLSIARGFRATMTQTGDDDTAIVLRQGSASEDSSAIIGEHASVIGDAPGIVRGPDGAVASAEVYTIVNVARKSTGMLANVPLRGVGRMAFAIREELRVVEGRRFEPGRYELLVGRGAAQQFEGLDVGRTVQWGANTWTIVGLFEAGGGITESELWCDARILQDAYRRGNTFQSVYARLESPDALWRLEASLTADPRLNVKAVSEAEYYAETSRLTSQLVSTLGFAIAMLMGIGAVFGAANTMYSAVATRTREIATLRALGFGASAVVLSVLVEAAVLAALGGLLGGAAAWLLFDGVGVATLNQQTYTQVAFAFAVTPRLLTEGAGYALLMGLVAGLPPAVRAARMQIATALREL